MDVMMNDDGNEREKDSEGRDMRSAGSRTGHRMSRRRHGIWASFCLSMSTFTMVPFPQYAFDPSILELTLAFFPLAGFFGATLAGFSLYALHLLKAGLFLRSVAAVSLIVMASGAIHLDGFADTCDALFSRRDRKEQLRIMKDPHIGVFAVIGTILLLAAALAAWMEILETGRTLLILAALLYGVFARSLSGLFSTTLPSARADGMLHALLRKAPRAVNRALTAALVLSGLVLIAAAHWSGLIAVIAALLTFAAFRRFSMKAFGGATGDLAGFLLSVLEVGGWIVLALTRALPVWYGW